MQFVVILAQGRSGSTLLMRMLNAVPGVRIAGENSRSLDHLRSFLRCYEDATTRHDSEFYRLAWSLPCPLPQIRDAARRFVADLYNPDGTYQVAGFKEIRYGLQDYGKLCHDVAFLRDLMPGLKIIFNTRQTLQAIKSEWWANNPVNSYRLLNRSRSNFERYHREHRDFTFLAPYESLCNGSSQVKALFEFLELESSARVEAELARQLR